MDDGRPDFRQQIKWTETAAQIDPIFPRAADHPSDDELIVDPVSGLLEFLLDPFRHVIEHCLYGCLFFIVTNHVRSSATARDQSKSIENDRLASSRFAGDDVQSRPQLQRCLVNHSKILDLKLTQHRGSLTAHPTSAYRAGSHSSF